jgi:hypothetical protein
MLAACAMACAGAALASSAPAWMHAQHALPLPAYDEKIAAVELYDETVMTVESAGRFKLLQRSVYRILRPAGAAVGTFSADLRLPSRITDIHAWCIPASGADYEIKAREAAETALRGVASGALMTDLRSTLIRAPAAVPGSTVGFEVEMEISPTVMAHTWRFQKTVPVREAQFTLRLPAGWSYRGVWLNAPESEPVTLAANQWRWTVHDVKDIKIQQHMAPWAGSAGALFASFIPPAAQGIGLTTWDGIGVWFLALAEHQGEASPALKAKVEELTATETTLPGKVRAVSSFVQEEIRYVGVELGVGAYQPRKASEVLSLRYGDCKDKANLLLAMLREIGVDGTFLFVNTARGFVTPASPANLDFNHVIVAIKLPAAEFIPSLLTAVDTGKLGRVVIFDPTADLTPLGMIPAWLQGGYGLLATPQGSELVRIPILPADASGVRRTGMLSIDEAGKLTGDIVEERLGITAVPHRQSMRGINRDTEQIRPIEAVVGKSLASFQITKATVTNLHTTDQPLVYHYSLEAEQYGKPTADLLLVRPRVVGTHASSLLETDEPRVQPVEFDGTELDTDEFTIALPAGYAVDELPPPVRADYGFASYERETTASGHTLHYRRRFEIKALSVPVAAVPELRALYRTIYNDERLSAVLRRTSH